MGHSLRYVSPGDISTDPLEMKTQVELTAETRLLLASLREFAGTGGPENLRIHASEVHEWEGFIDLARAHWMEPLVAWQLRAACAEMLGPAVLPALDTIIRRSAARHLLLSAELIKVLRILRAHGIAVLPFKGPVLAATLCDQMVWRESSDLDFLVRRAEVTRARDALIAAGYRLDSYLPSGEENAAFHWRSQLVMFPEGGGPSIDLHWQLLPSLWPGARCLDSVWDRVKTTTFHDQDVRVFSAEDQLFFLCAHGARHYWRSLRLVADVARFIHVCRELEWDCLIRLVRSSDGGPVLALGLWLANRLLRVGLPPPVLEYVDASMDKNPFAPVLLKRLLDAPREPQALSEFGLQLRLATGWGAKLRCAASYVLLPSDADGESLRLPPALFFLYYLFRPWRLAWKYLKSSLRSLAGNLADAKWICKTRGHRAVSLPRHSQIKIARDLGES
jgi:hypothetical protein